MPRILNSLVVALSLSCGGFAPPAPAQQAQVIPHGQKAPPGPALSPAEAVKNMTVPPGFSVEVVASEPDIVNPVAMTFDDRGRIWITESLEYPRSAPGPGRDRIKVLEDTDGDGTADRFTIFADGLNIPSGIAVGHGGVWVANAPDILFLRDVDGDGKADTREVVVTGFGRTDTHELPNSLTWGPDGWLYGWNGVFNQSQVQHKGRTFNFTCAIFRIHPKTRDFELFCEGTSNPWGIAVDPEGNLFASACVIDHLWHLTETGYYHRQGGPYPPHTWKIESIVDHKHQQAAYCGITYYDSDAYPAAYRDRLYMGNIHGNCINVDVLKRSGSTYRSEAAPDFLAANDAWFMPVSQKTGPDGCLYILDWYDRYHCYQDARRDPEGIDRLKGRLYRVRYRETPRVVGFDLSREPNAKLIERLQGENSFFRDQARRLVAERDDPEVRPVLRRLALDTQASRKARLNALWALIGTGRLEPDFHARLLEDADPGLRAWAVRAAGNMKRVEPAIIEKVVALAEDHSPDVQVQVAIASPKLLGIKAFPVLSRVLSVCGDDVLIPRIVWANLNPLLETDAVQFADIVERTDLAAANNLAALIPRVIERILDARTIQPTAIVPLITKLIDSRRVSEAERSLVVLTTKIQTRELPTEEATRLREALLPVLRSVRAQAEADDEALNDAATLLAATWNDREGLTKACNILRNPMRPDERRLRALDALIVAGRHDDALKAVADLLADPDRGSQDMRGKMISALGRLDDPQVATLALSTYGRVEPELRPRIIELLTQRVSWARDLLAAIGRDQVPRDALNVNQIRKLIQSRDKAILDQVHTYWGTLREGRNPAREQVIAQMRDYLRQTPGDPFLGRQVFQRVCAQCHKIYGEGQDVGPEITGVGRSELEQLLSNVFDPSLVIGPSYQATTVATTEGRVLTGLLVEDTPARIVLKTQGGKLETVPRGEVEESKVSEVSLMPENLEKQLQPQEIADLFAFLGLDKPPSDPTARRLPGLPEPKRRTLSPSR
jgi:putative membrane-bound dehydrogenase-like protein